MTSRLLQQNHKIIFILIVFLLRGNLINFNEQVPWNNAPVHSFSPTSISHVFADKLHFSRFSMAAMAASHSSSGVGFLCQALHFTDDKT